MNPAIANETKVQRDFIFFVSGISDEMVIHHEQYTFASVGEDQRKQITEISKHSQGVANWLNKTTGKFHAAIFRNDHTDEGDAFSEAFERLSSILDGFAFLIEDAQLGVCPLVAVRERNEMDAQIAATARVHGAAVATRNTKDFLACEIALIDPWSDTPAELQH